MRVWAFGSISYFLWGLQKAYKVIFKLILFRCGIITLSLYMRERLRAAAKVRMCWMRWSQRVAFFFEVVRICEKNSLSTRRWVEVGKKQKKTAILKSLAAREYFPPARTSHWMPGWPTKPNSLLSFCIVYSLWFKIAWLIRGFDILKALVI